MTNTSFVETKNGAVVRKQMGYLHIGAEHAAPIHDFYREHLNPYLNFHRPGGQADIITDSKDKEKRIYNRYATPWEGVQQLPDPAQHLRPGQTMAALAAEAPRISDTESGRRMQEAKCILFGSFYPEACPA